MNTEVKETQIDKLNNIVVLANQNNTQKEVFKSKMKRKQIKSIPNAEPNIQQKWRMYKEIDEPYMLRDLIPKEEDEFIKQLRQAMGEEDKTQEQMDLENIIKAERKGLTKSGNVYSTGDLVISTAPVSMKSAEEKMIESFSKSRAKAGSSFYDDSKNDLSDLYKSERLRSSQIVGSIQRTPEQIANEIKSKALKDFSYVPVSRRDIPEEVKSKYLNAIETKSGTQQLRDRKKFEDQAKKDLIASYERASREREQDNQFFNKQMEISLRESKIQNEASRLLQSALRRKLDSKTYETEKKREKSIQKSFSVYDIESSIKKDKQIGRGLLLQPSDLFEVPEKGIDISSSLSSLSSLSQPAKRGRGRPAGSKNTANTRTLDLTL
jgi:hypothetical protein